MIRRLTFVFFALSSASELIHRNKDLNPNCPDLELWHECTTDCSAKLIQCINACDTDQNCISNCNRNAANCEHRCPCDQNCRSGCIGCNNDICFKNYGAFLIMNNYLYNQTTQYVLMNMNGEPIDGFDFHMGDRTDVFGSCATSFKGSMYVFGGFVHQRQVSRVQNCGLEYIDTMPFNLANGACQSRLNNQVLLCFSDDAERDCWRFDEHHGELSYQKEMPQSKFSHKHNPMATYHGNPLAIASCWGLEVEMLDRRDETWKRMADYPNPGGYGNEVFDTVSLNDRVYTFGGYWKNNTNSETVFMFKDNVWSNVGEMMIRRRGAGAMRFYDQIYVIGGQLEDESPTQLERWTLEENNDLLQEAEIFGMELDNYFFPNIFLVPEDFCVKTI